MMHIKKQIIEKKKKKKESKYLEENEF